MSILCSHLWILSRAECLLLCWGCFLISFRLPGDAGFERWDKFIKAFSSRSMLCVCVTAIDGVGLTTPVGVVVDATDVAGLIKDKHVVCVVVETVALRKCSLLDFCWLNANGCWATDGKGGRGWRWIGNERKTRYSISLISFRYPNSHAYIHYIMEWKGFWSDKSICYSHTWKSFLPINDDAFFFLSTV